MAQLVAPPVIKQERPVCTLLRSLEGLVRFGGFSRYYSLRIQSENPENGAADAASPFFRQEDYMRRSDDRDYACASNIATWLLY
jgi:hypothetical protein